MRNWPATCVGSPVLISSGGERFAGPVIRKRAHAVRVVTTNRRVVIEWATAVCGEDSCQFREGGPLITAVSEDPMQRGRACPLRGEGCFF